MTGPHENLQRCEKNLFVLLLFWRPHCQNCEGEFASLYHHTVVGSAGMMCMGGGLLYEETLPKKRALTVVWAINVKEKRIEPLLR